MGQPRRDAGLFFVWLAVVSSLPLELFGCAPGENCFILSEQAQWL
jgi:hypothetical protein